MKKLKFIISMLLTLLLLIALPVTALAASEAPLVDIGVNWVTIALYAEAAAVLLFGFLVSYFKTSSVFRGFVAQLIADAEVKYANIEKAGKLKMAWVIDKLYSIIPIPLKIIFTKERLEAFAQEVFEQVTAYATIQCDKAVKALQDKYNANKNKSTK